MLVSCSAELSCCCSAYCLLSDDLNAGRLVVMKPRPSRSRLRADKFEVGDESEESVEVEEVDEESSLMQELIAFSQSWRSAWLEAPS